MFLTRKIVMSEDNEALVNRFHMDIFQKGDLAAADEILAPNFIWRNPSLPSDLKHGPEGVKKIASATSMLYQIVKLLTMIPLPKETR
jgi:hypothetical protein